MFWQFLDVWKKSNIVPVHEKGDKQLIKNYRPVPLLPIRGKLLEKLILNSQFSILLMKNFPSVHQSGFRLGDFCLHQLIAFVYDIYDA